MAIFLGELGQFEVCGVPNFKMHPNMDTSDLEGPPVISKAILFGSLRTGISTSTKITVSVLASRIGGHFQNDSLSKLRAVVNFTHFVFLAFGFDSLTVLTLKE